MVNSIRKGKRGELEAAAYLHGLGFIDARRSQQYNGLGHGDVICEHTLPNLHIEVKFGYSVKKNGKVVQDMHCSSTAMRDALLKVGRDAGGGPWALLWKPDGYRQWRCTARINGLLSHFADDDTIKAVLLELDGSGGIIDD